MNDASKSAEDATRPRGMPWLWAIPVAAGLLVLAVFARLWHARPADSLPWAMPHECVTTAELRMDRLRALPFASALEEALGPETRTLLARLGVKLTEDVDTLAVGVILPAAKQAMPLRVYLFRGRFDRNRVLDGLKALFPDYRPALYRRHPLAILSPHDVVAVLDDRTLAYGDQIPVCWAVDVSDGRHPAAPRPLEATGLYWRQARLPAAEAMRILQVLAPGAAEALPMPQARLESAIGLLATALWDPPGRLTYRVSIRWSSDREAQTAEADVRDQLRSMPGSAAGEAFPLIAAAASRATVARRRSGIAITTSVSRESMPELIRELFARPAWESRQLRALLLQLQGEPKTESR